MATKAAASIAGALYSDSRIRLDVSLIDAALTEDMESGEAEPTDEECEQLVMGDDEGEVPQPLESRYPATNALIKDQF